MFSQYKKHISLCESTLD